MFFDKDNNPVERGDEKDYNINDILNNNNIIELKNENNNNTSEVPPASI